MGRYTFSSFHLSAFTLIELLVSIAIIGILSSVLITKIDPLGQINKAQDAKRQEDLTTLKIALDSYYNDKKCYPQSLTDLTTGEKPYQVNMPKDPTTQQQYGYATKGSCPQAYVLFSKLRAASAGSNTNCPLQAICPQSLPTGFDSTWACRVSGTNNCSDLAALVTLGQGGGVTIITPTVVTPTPSSTPSPTPTTDPTAACTFTSNITASGFNFNQSNVAADSAGNIYTIGYYPNDTILKFDPNGSLVSNIHWGHGTGYALAIDKSNTIYVSGDPYGVNILKLDSNGNLVSNSTLGSLGSGDGQFYAVNGIAVDQANNVYVADYNNGRVQKFDSSGHFLTKFGSFNFNGYSVGIAVDQSNNVYVGDTNNYLIKKFDSSGHLLTQWGGQDWGGKNAANGKFYNIDGIAVDQSNNVYVADYGNYRIQKFDSSGHFLTKWTLSSAQPIGVVVNKYNILYVSTAYPETLQKYTCPGAGMAPTVTPTPTIDPALRVSGYKDADNDGYATGGEQTFPGTVLPTGYKKREDLVSTVEDCDDNNANAHPDQTQYFSTPRSNGSYDYNCDGIEDIKMPCSDDSLGINKNPPQVSYSSSLYLTWCAGNVTRDNAATLCRPGVSFLATLDQYNNYGSASVSQVSAGPQGYWLGLYNQSGQIVPGVTSGSCYCPPGNPNCNASTMNYGWCWCAPGSGSCSWPNCYLQTIVNSDPNSGSNGITTSYTSRRYASYYYPGSVCLGGSGGFPGSFYFFDIQDKNQTSGTLCMSTVSKIGK